MWCTPGVRVVGHSDAVDGCLTCVAKGPAHGGLIDPDEYRADMLDVEVGHGAVEVHLPAGTVAARELGVVDSDLAIGVANENQK